MVQAAEGLNASGADGRKLRVPPAPSAKSQPLEPPVVTAVYTSDDLTEALKSGMEHIEIHNHLDLTGWSWGDEDREFDDNYVDVSFLEIPESVVSFTVRRRTAAFSCIVEVLSIT